MDASKNADFLRIEAFVKSLQPGEREGILKILSEKATNKFNDDSKKSKDEGERLLKIIEDNFSALDKK